MSGSALQIRSPSTGRIRDHLTGNDILCKLVRVLVVLWARWSPYQIGHRDWFYSFASDRVLLHMHIISVMETVPQSRFELILALGRYSVSAEMKQSKPSLCADVIIPLHICRAGSDVGLFWTRVKLLCSRQSR